MNYRETGYSLLRFAFGVVFLFSGVGKFMGGLGNFVGGMNQHFAGKLPAFMVMPFAYALPFGETLAGALIFFGLFTRLGLMLSGLLLVGLTFGTVMLGDFPTVAHNVQYAFVNFVLLWASEYNGISLDRAIHGRSTVGSVT